MRILAASDIHGVSTVYEWLIEQARVNHVDAIVLAGDLLASDFIPEQIRAARKIVALLRQASVPVLYIMGNDDNVSIDCDDEYFIPVHGRRILMDEFYFVGYQFTAPFAGEIFVKTEEDMAVELSGMDDMIDGSTILVTHGPAWGSLDLSFGERAGSPSLQRLIERRKPLAHIHGHIHQQFGRDGLHFNVSSAGLPRAIVLDLPSLTHKMIGDRTVTDAAPP